MDNELGFLRKQTNSFLYFVSFVDKELGFLREQTNSFLYFVSFVDSSFVSFVDLIDFEDSDVAEQDASGAIFDAVDETEGAAEGECVLEAARSPVAGFLAEAGGRPLRRLSLDLDEAAELDRLERLAVLDAELSLEAVGLSGLELEPAVDDLAFAVGAVVDDEFSFLLEASDLDLFALNTWCPPKLSGDEPAGGLQRRLCGLEPCGLSAQLVQFAFQLAHLRLERLVSLQLILSPCRQCQHGHHHQQHPQPMSSVHVASPLCSVLSGGAAQPEAPYLPEAGTRDIGRAVAELDGHRLAVAREHIRSRTLQLEPGASLRVGADADAFAVVPDAPDIGSGRRLDDALGVGAHPQRRLWDEGVAVGVVDGVSDMGGVAFVEPVTGGGVVDFGVDAESDAPLAAS